MGAIVALQAYQSVYDRFFPSLAFEKVAECNAATKIVDIYAALALRDDNETDVGRQYQANGREHEGSLLLGLDDGRWVGIQQHLLRKPFVIVKPTLLEAARATWGPHRKNYGLYQFTPSGCSLSYHTFVHQVLFRHIASEQASMTSTSMRKHDDVERRWKTMTYEQKIEWIAPHDDDGNTLSSFVAELLYGHDGPVAYSEPLAAMRAFLRTMASVYGSSSSSSSSFSSSASSASPSSASSFPTIDFPTKAYYGHGAIVMRVCHTGTPSKPTLEMVLSKAKEEEGTTPPEKGEEYVPDTPYTRKLIDCDRYIDTKTPAGTNLPGSWLTRSSETYELKSFDIGDDWPFSPPVDTLHIKAAMITNIYIGVPLLCDENYVEMTHPQERDRNNVTRYGRKHECSLIFGLDNGQWVVIQQHVLRHPFVAFATSLADAALKTRKSSSLRTYTVGAVHLTSRPCALPFRTFCYQVLAQHIQNNETLSPSLPMYHYLLENAFRRDMTPDEQCAFLSYNIHNGIQSPMIRAVTRGEVAEKSCSKKPDDDNKKSVSLWGFICTIVAPALRKSDCRYAYDEPLDAVRDILAVMSSVYGAAMPVVALPDLDLLRSSVARTFRGLHRPKTDYTIVPGWEATRSANELCTRVIERAHKDYFTSSSSTSSTSTSNDHGCGRKHDDVRLERAWIIVRGEDLARDGTHWCDFSLVLKTNHGGKYVGYTHDSLSRDYRTWTHVDVLQSFSDATRAEMEGTCANHIFCDKSVLSDRSSWATFIDMHEDAMLPWEREAMRHKQEEDEKIASSSSRGQTSYRTFMTIAAFRYLTGHDMSGLVTGKNVPIPRTFSYTSVYPGRNFADVRPEDRIRDVFVLNVSVMLRRLPAYAFGANHWGALLELSNGQWAISQKNSNSHIYLDVCDSKRAAAMRMWGDASAVRFCDYGRATKDRNNWHRERRALLAPRYDEYILGPKDCQNWARKVVHELAGETVGWWPFESTYINL